MKILVSNLGSTTFKYKLFDMPAATVLARGGMDRIGDDGGDFFAQDLASQRDSIRLPDGTPWREVEAILPPGGVSIHHRDTLHGSGPNVSNQPRRSFAIHMRTDKSETVDAARIGLTEFLEDPRCPIVYRV